MRWVPPRAGDLGLDGRAAGMHKVAGTTVEAVVGGVLHQFVRWAFSLSLSLLPNDAGANQWLGGEYRSQAFPYACASAPVAPRLTIRATRRPSC
jgi:hypothetical protein